MSKIETPIKEKTLFQCKQCERFVPPIKRPGLFFLWFPGLWLPYLIYYYFFKKPECVYCGYQFKNADLKLELVEADQS